MPSIRISKVIVDLKIARTTLVDFLNSKGFPVEDSPNAKISSEELNAVIAEFAKDRSPEERKAMLEQYLSPKGEKGKSQGTASSLEQKKEEATTHSEKNATPTSKEKPSPEAQPDPTSPKVGLTIKGKIDLEPKPAKKVEVKETPSGQSRDVDVDKVKPEAPPTLPKKESKKEEVLPHASTPPVLQTEKPATKEEKTPQPSPVLPPVSSIEAEPKGQEEKKELLKEAPVESKKKDLPPTKNPPKPQEPVASTKEPVKSSDAETKPVENEGASTEVYRIASEEPSMGVKVVGKVDLASIDPHGRGSADSKKKRKRINRKKVDVEKQVVTDPQQRPQQRKGGGATPPQRQEKGRKAKRQQKLQPKPEVSQEEIQKQIKETLAAMQNQNKRVTNQGAKYRKDKRDAHRRDQEHLEKLQSEDRTLQLTEYVTANDLAQMIEVPVTEIITMCFNLGMMVSINQRLEKETIDLILDEYGYEPDYVEADVLDAIQVEEDREEDLLPRAPIVTVMGHVDHGKTSLLDSIRDTNVISGEAGGITQHVGAYSVTLEDGRKITFLDTPGHEAFTAMRARGAKVTDIVIVVVAADDGVMPQTKEAINHASIAGVPIIFAINKVDKDHADPEKIKAELAELNYLVEDWGGKYQSQHISAKKGIGIRELLEKVLLEAELLDLKANPNKRAVGSVLESTMEVGRGYTTKVLIQEGTLKVGDYILAGVHHGRVKALFNERGLPVQSVGPADPVKVLGLNGAAQAGEAFNVLETEQEVRDIAGKRLQLQREQKERTQKIPTLQSLGQRIADGNIQDLNVIVKGDVDGSVEALSDSIVKLSTEEVRVNVIHKAVGQISDSDVVLASASDAVIIGFQVRPAASARRLAENEGVEIRTYSIIYNALDDVKSAMEGMLSPEVKERVTANLEVRETFRITKVGTVAGCAVKDGKISRTDKVRLIRDGIVIFSGALGSLKRFKDDVKEVGNGYECGLNLENFNDIQVGDQIEAYEEIEVKKTL